MTTTALTSADRARIKAELEARRAALRADVKTQLEGKESGDEWGVVDGLAELDIAEVRHTLAELSEVEAALARLAGGTYGECRDCGEPIAPARLAVYPTATRCVACQQAYEARIAGPAATAR
jgi:RNA polymerase-binding transcription factor DksA